MFAGRPIGLTGFPLGLTDFPMGDRRRKNQISLAAAEYQAFPKKDARIPKVFSCSCFFLFFKILKRTSSWEKP